MKSKFFLAFAVLALSACSGNSPVQSSSYAPPSFSSNVPSSVSENSEPSSNTSSEEALSTKSSEHDTSSDDQSSESENQSVPEISSSAPSSKTSDEGGNSSEISSESSDSSKEVPVDLSNGESITYWCPNTDIDFFAAKVKEFKALHPEYNGEITQLATVGEGDVKGELTKDPEKAADVFEIADDNILDCVLNRALTPFDTEEVAKMKELYGETAVTAASFRGNVYGVPYRNDNGYVLSYDKTIVSDEDAKTIEGIVAACKKAGATFNFNLTNSWYTFAPVWAAGGRTYTDDSGVFHSEIATDAVAEALAGFQNIIRNAGATWNHNDDDAYMAIHKVGAVVKWNNETAEKELLGDKLGITVLPSFTVGGASYQLKSFQGFKALGMRKASAMTDNKLIVARAFCMFMGSDKIAQDRLTTLDQGVSNKAVIAKGELWNSQWFKALGAQQEAGNTVSQANGSSGKFWSAAETLGRALKGGALRTKAIALTALQECEIAQNARGQQTSPSQTYAVRIFNKENLQATWMADDVDRSLELSLNPTVNILDALADGTLIIESSNPEVVSVNGLTLTPLANGQATIDVIYHTAIDSITVFVGGATQKYGTVHAGTLEDPLDNADAVKVGLSAKDNDYTEESLYIKGQVERFYEAPGERADGAVTFFLKAEGEDQQFQVYRALKKDAEGKTSALTYKEITVGANVVVYGRITYYAKGNQAETSQGTTFFVSSDKGETEDPKVVEVESVAKAVEEGKKLVDGASEYDFVKVTGFVVIKDGSNYWLADEKSPKDPRKTDLLELYGVSDDDAKICLKGAKITVTFRIKNYHNQIEAIAMKDFVEVAKGELW